MGINRRGFLKGFGTAAVAATTIDFSKLFNRKVLTKTAEAKPAPKSQVKFVYDRETILDAEVIGEHTDKGVLQLDLLVKFPVESHGAPMVMKGKAYPAGMNLVPRRFLRVRGASAKDLTPNFAGGVWYVE